MTRSGGSTLSAVVSLWPSRSTSSLPRKKRSTPTSRIVATEGNLTPQAGLEPLTGPIDGLDPRAGLPYHRPAAHFVQPRAHLAYRVRAGGELVPARNRESNRHVHLPEVSGVGDRRSPFLGEPGGDPRRETRRESVEIRQTPIPK